MSRGLKLAKRELTRLGYTILYKSPGKIKFQLSNSEWVCTSGTPLPHVRAVIARERLASRVSTGNYLEAFPIAHTWPDLNEGDFYVTKHGRERLAHMRDQGLVMREIHAAVFAPETVRKHGGNLIYCSGRIGVVIGGREQGKHPLVSVLWATDDLWEQYPRPDGSRT